jgi:hypothetical protein
MRRATLATAPLVAAVAVAGCGSPSPDLFVIQRSGQDPGANVHLVVSDGGTVRCNDRKPVSIDADLLLDARQLARDLSEPAELGVRLPRGRRSVLSYRARVEAGTVSFSDTSPTRPHVFDRLAAFTKHVAETVCGIRR